MLETLITSKTRLNLLVKFFINIANTGYLNSLANEFGESTNSVRKELNNLSSAGYLKKEQKNNKVIYSANVEHPMFNIIRKVVLSHLGIQDIINNILDNIGEIKTIQILGDYAKGIDTGYIDVLIVGKKINLKYIDSIQPKIESKINRKINIMVSRKTTFLNALTVFEA